MARGPELDALGVLILALVRPQVDSGNECRPGQGVSVKAGTYLYTDIVDRDSLSGQGPTTFANCPVRTRMRGGVGREG